MRMAAVLALAALVALVVALVTGSTWPAFLVIALAGAGIVLLVQDWRADRGHAPAVPPPAEDPAPRADGFAPDISTDPAGPSSDARADQV